MADVLKLGASKPLLRNGDFWFACRWVQHAAAGLTIPQTLTQFWCAEFKFQTCLRHVLPPTSLTLLLEGTTLSALRFVSRLLSCLAA